jgi:hypothetical protein
MMKKLLIALATTVALVGPAHAEIVARDPDRIFDCSNVGWGNVIATSEHLSDAQAYNVQIVIPRHEKAPPPPPVVVFDMSRANTKGTGLKLKVNGKSCKAIEQ